MYIERNIPHEKDWLRKFATWSDMSLFNSFRILIGILLGPSLLSWSKEEKMFETSVLSVGVISDGLDGGLDIYSNISKSVV